jgi:nonspecific dipeptidase
LADILSCSSHFLHNAKDFFCISDNYWLGKTKPCITYGLRGIASFEVFIECSEQDLHSGVLGGVMHEGMTDLVYLLSSLKDPSGKILVEGLMDDVAKVTPEEEALYKDIEFDVEAFKVRRIGKNNFGSCCFRTTLKLLPFFVF